MNEALPYLEAIRQRYPELPLDTAEKIGAGQNNDVWLINGRLIFRFPKYESAIRDMEREVAFLLYAADHVSLEIPRPVFIHTCPSLKELPFIGYNKIAGEPLEADLLQAEASNDSHEEHVPNEAFLRHIAGQLDDFLQELHGLDPKDLARAQHDPGYDGCREWSDMYERIQSRLYPCMKQGARTWTDRHFSAFLGCKANFEITPSLIHGDFGTSNILYEPVSKRVSGILDFGSAGMGDPAVDYAALLASYGESFFRLVLVKNPKAREMLSRIIFYKGTFALQEALFGVENEDPEALKSGLETLEALE
ncbi:phosphotransferase family protein [Paenibacillus chitinolyticus]|uniref:phosphotransferase family protein n=1 Tax=Paenibacillus chitinolyticus TaxID=79263 RepID=UPI00362A28E4